MHIYLLVMHLILSWQDYENAFINAHSSSLEHIEERLAAFILSQAISPTREFYCTPDFVLDENYLCVIVILCVN
jgi:hypothetical protein